ncbi:pre-mRNA-splicing factor SLT11 [Cubamyces sp. BRFM 1775]|nr:pre-mRNA-splicing factor SLT11 [Cubamyces sp. BRFM 1775]
MPKSDINKAGWEQSEFPILCETCLGDNPFIRMSKQEFGRSCGTCARPFTVFRWNPGTGMRFKTTVICQTCAKIKNVCQTCLLDLEYGLPTQVRDTALGVESEAPTSEINREYYAQNMESKLDGAKSLLDVNTRASSAGKEMLKQLARTDPYYKRNRPHICSFYAKGECNRGDACPYRHEMPVQNELSKQNIQDRYHGRNDPVAKKILSTHAASMGLQPPEDQSITSLFLSSLPASATEESVRTRVLKSLPAVQPSQLKSVVYVAKSRCAFVNWKDRATAELAAQAWANGLEIDGETVSIRWGRSKSASGSKKPATSSVASSSSAIAS